MSRTAQHISHLATSNRQQMPLTLAQLEKGLASLEAPHAKTNNNAQLSSQFLGRFGLKNAQDVMVFLKTPAGKSISNMMAEQLADLESIGKAAHSKQQKKQLMHRRFIIALLLEMIYEREAHTKQLNRDIQEDIDKSLKQQKAEPESTEAVATIEIDAQLMLFHESAEALNSLLTNKLNDYELLENELALLSEESLEIEARYAMYDKYLSDLTLDRTSPNTELLQTTIKDVELQMSSYTTILSALLNEGKETEAHNTLQMTQALHFKADMLKMMNRAQQEERSFFNQQGNRVQSIAEADFMVPKNQTLAFEGNQYYLYPRSKELSALSPEQKIQAQEAYQQSAKDIMSIKMQLQLRRTQETSLHQDKKTALSSKVDSLKQEVNLLAALLTRIQAARAALQNNMPQANAPTTTPRPSPSLNKPELNYGHRHGLTPQRRLDLELLMNNPATAAKKALEESQKLQAMRLAQAKLKPSSPTPSPFNMKLRPF